MINQTSNPALKKNEQEIGALWKRVSKSGSQTYLSGNITVDDFGTPKTLKVVVFSNKNKKNEKAPDFRVYLSKDAAASTTATATSATPTRTTEARAAAPAPAPEPVPEEDLI